MRAPESAEDFCRRHDAEFEGWSGEEAARQLRLYWPIAALLAVGSAWSWHRTDGSPDAWVSYAPASFALAAACYVHTTYPGTARRDAVGHHTLCLALFVVGMAHSVVVLASRGGSAQNAPIQFTLFLACMLLPAGRFAWNARAGVSFALAAAAFLAAGQGFDFIAKTAIQFVVGAATGLFVNRQLTLARMYRFQSVLANSSDKAHALAELTKLVPPHVVAHIHEGGGLESSMPVGKADACVIAFDIVDSTRQDDPGFPAAVEAVLARCHGIMMEGYCMDPLEANAYRLKDMGDGFLATVGFPFHVPTQRSTGIQGDDRALAVALAERFVGVFEEEMAHLASREDGGALHCCVGIVRGRIEGFFPKAGVKQYELRGHAISLATRYEGLRRCIFPKTGYAGNLIVLREDVHAGLCPDDAAHYAAWDTKVPGQAVRDDPEAQRAYYRFMGEDTDVTKGSGQENTASKAASRVASKAA